MTELEFELKSILISSTSLQIPQGQEFVSHIAVLVWENNRVWNDENSFAKDNETTLKSPESLTSHPFYS